MIKKLIIHAILCCYSLIAFPQEEPGNSVSSHGEILLHDSTLSLELPAVDKKKLWLNIGAHTAIYGGSLLILNEAWFKGYPKTSFQTFDDSREWLQIDKIGHAWTVYNLAKFSTASWKWTGMDHKKAMLAGSLSGLGYMILIEFLDAHSANWGWSWADIGANLVGSGMFLSQQLAWNEQRIQFKFSSYPKKYDASLRERTDELFGTSLPEKILKDYNAQTYWLSVNPSSFSKTGKLPRWLNMSIGYGAKGMLGGFENKWANAAGDTITRYDIDRVRQFYLSPDIDFTKIETNKKFLKVLFTLLNAFKFPAPALMLDSRGKMRFYALYF